MQESELIELTAKALGSEQIMDASYSHLYEYAQAVHEYQKAQALAKALRSLTAYSALAKAKTSLIEKQAMLEISLMQTKVALKLEQEINGLRNRALELQAKSLK